MTNRHMVPKKSAATLLSLLVALCLVLSLFPVGGIVFADEGEADSLTEIPVVSEETEEAEEVDADESAEPEKNTEAEAPEVVASDDEVVDLATQEEPVVPLAGEIATMIGSVVTTPTNPASGAEFKMTVELNSISEGVATTDGIKNAQVKFTIPNNVEIQSLPVSNGLYTVTPANPQPGDEVTITYNSEFPVGSLKKLEMWFRFPAGVSLASETFAPEIKLSASNAFPHTMTAPTVNPYNNPLGTVMQVTPQDVNPIFLHTATIDLTREAYYAGLNQNNAQVKIDFPADAEVVSVTYKGVTYPLTDNGAAGKTVSIPIGTLGVGDQGNKEQIKVLYSYPPMTSPGQTDYEIDITYSATRFDGTPIVETDKIEETVSHSNGGADANSFFSKSASYQVYRIGASGLSFELNFTPSTDMKGIVLTDDPVRAGETDFFNAVEYKVVTWTHYSALNPSTGQTVRTQMFYQTQNDPGVWHSAGVPSASGTVNLENLGLGAGDYVTNVQFKFFGDSGDEIPSGSTPVKIRLQAVSKDTITATGTSYDDNVITNGAYLTGSLKFPGAANYEAIDDDGIKNAKTSTTKIVANNPEMGLAGWENPVSPNPIIPGEELTFSVRHYSTNAIVRDAVSYCLVDENIDILDVTMDSRFPNASWSVSEPVSGFRIVTVEWNGDITDPWQQYQFSIKGKAQSDIGDSAYFRYLVASKDEAQAFGGSNAGFATSYYLNNWRDYPLINLLNGDPYGVTMRWGIPVDHSLGMNPTKLASTDSTNYSLTQVVDTSTAPAGKPGYFSLAVKNPGSTPLTEVRIIDALPVIGDQMTINANAKKTSITLPVESVTNMDGSALAPSVKVYYSSDATPASNKAELIDFTAVTATWTQWTGGAFPAGIKAVKVVKEDGLTASEEFSVRLNVTLPQNVSGTTLVGWNSMSAGGLHSAGQIVPGEPHKSGIYISTGTADKKLGGYLWYDDNGNDQRDSSERILANTIVTLYDWDDSYIGETKTNSSGYYEFDGLLPERYRVEIALPSNNVLCGYQLGGDKGIDNDFVQSDTYLASATVNLATETHPLTVDAGFYSKVSVGDYVWADTNGNGLQDSFEDGLAGASVSLFRLEGSTYTPSGSTTTDTNGRYTFSNLRPGTYYVSVGAITDHEPTALAAGGAGAVNDSKIKESWNTEDFVLVSGQNRLDIDAGVARLSNGSVTITKVDENNAPLAGATFGIWASTANTETDAPLKSVTSGNNGQVLFTDMPIGSYIVKETSAPTGYDAISTEFTATISKAQLDVVLSDVVNTLSLGSVSLTKVDNANNPLAGATFGIYPYSASTGEGTLIKSVTSGADGVVAFTDMPQGTYMVRETSAPEGFDLSNTGYLAVIDKTNLYIDLGLINNLLSDGDIVLTKVDEEGNPLANASFGIWEASADPTKDQPIGVIKSGADGVVKLEDQRGASPKNGLSQGSYKIMEISAPDGYVKSDKIYEVTLDRSVLSINLGKIVNKKELEGPIVPGPDKPGPEKPKPGTTDPKAPGGTPGPGGTSSTGDDTALLVGILAGLAVLGLLALVIILIFKRRKKDEEEERVF